MDVLIYPSNDEVSYPRENWQRIVFYFARESDELRVFRSYMWPMLEATGAVYAGGAE